MPLFTGNKFGFGLSNEAGGAAAPSGPTSHVASGGIISDYTVGSDKYRAHIFTSPGTFVVSTISADSSNYPADTDYFLVAGGGGGGAGHPGSSVGAGGGGGGGYVTAPAGITITEQTYPITVGRGGVGAEYNDDTAYYA